jgi:SAM-dependent methyltransferase
VTSVRHLPYQIDSTQRGQFYETFWKIRALELLRRHVEPQGLSLLDYGCGRGETLQIFGDAGMIVTGVDTDPECVRLSSRFGAAHVLEGDGAGQFGNGEFDVVSCLHVLEHVENPKQILRTIASLSRKFVLLAVPNLRVLGGLTTREFKLDYFNEGHLQSWDHLHFLNLAVRHCGLELVGWGSDATYLPLVSHLAYKILGNKACIALETGLFRRLFPYHSLSVLGLFRVKNPNPA